MHKLIPNLFLAMLLAVSAGALPAGAGGGYGSPHGKPKSALPAVHSSVVTGPGLEVYSDLAGFEAAVGDGLPLETFENGHVDTGEGAVCVEPVNNASDDACFAPGSLVGGFSVTSSSGDGVVLLAQKGEAGQKAGTVIGAQAYNDITIVSFDADDVTAVALDAFPGLDGGLDVTVRGYDASGQLIGSTTISSETQQVSEFVGFTSSAPVSRIELQTSNNGGELFHNLRFGASQSPIFRDRFET